MGGANPKAPRIEALDFTKGLLVVCMVAYHSLNYSTRYELGFRLMGFLPPSFIVITGFLLSRVYFARPVGEVRPVCRRLLVRGAKLFVLFTVLNVMAGLVRRTTPPGVVAGPAALFTQAFDVFVSGHGRLAVFEVLLPIAYLLMGGPMLLWLDLAHRRLVPALTAITLAACLVLEQQGALMPNPALMTAGLVGIVLGRIPGDRLDWLCRAWPLPVAAYVAYVGLVILLGQGFAIQLFGACAVLAVCYAVGLRAGARGWLSGRVITLGQHSLLAYIVQIAVLQLLAALMGRPEPASFEFAALFLAALALTGAFIEFTHWARGRSVSFHAAYRLAFG